MRRGENLGDFALENVSSEFAKSLGTGTLSYLGDKGVLDRGGLVYMVGKRKLGSDYLSEKEIDQREKILAKMIRNRQNKEMMNLLRETGNYYDV